jgi:cell division control protein 45
MLLQDHFTGTFYDVVKSEHPLVMVNLDVDAVCASMILFHAFTGDDVHYTVAYVDSPSTFEARLRDQRGQTKHVILINCYGHLSLNDADLLGDTKFFIIDSRRPFHLDNVFAKNVACLTFSNEILSWNLPKMEEIYQESDSSSDENEDDMEGDSNKIEHMVQRRTLKRLAKADWKRNRADTMWNYYSRTWYSIPSSVLFLELSHSMGKSTVSTTWCAAVALSSQYIDHLISFDQYSNVCMNHMRQFVAKYAPKPGQRNNGAILSITFDEEVMLPLYRKWDLYSAMTHDITFCCTNALWSQKGESVLKHNLATIGITLQECHQSFDSLPSARRKEIFDILSKHLDSNFSTFFSEYGYHQRYSSIDFARIMAAKLEYKHAHATDNLIKRAEDAKELLYTYFRNNGHDRAIKPAINEYQKGLDAVRGLVFNALHHSLVTAAAENFYMLTLDPASDIAYLSSRHFLNLFVHFVLTGFATSKNKKRSTKPIIFLIPAMINDENNRYWIVTGAMPFIDIVRETERKSLLPLAFRKVADRHNIPVIRDSFDPNILQIRHEDKVKFVENLDLMLEKI